MVYQTFFCGNILKQDSVFRNNSFIRVAVRIYSVHIIRKNSFNLCILMCITVVEAITIVRTEISWET
jgi:hypothetical protein